MKGILRNDSFHVVLERERVVECYIESVLLYAEILECYMESILLYAEIMGF